jgi:hypothetical protein
MRWIKGLVLVFGVADCAGLYYAHQRLSAPVPDSVRYDMAAITVPESRNAFHVEGAMLAAADRAALPVARAVPELAPAEAVTLPKLAVVAPLAPKAVAVPAVAAAAPKLAAAELSAAPRKAPVPALAAKAAPAHHVAAPAPALAAEAEPSPAPQRIAAHKAAHSLAGLVPRARHHSEFSQAFAGLDARVDTAQPLELGSPAIEPARVAAPTTDFAATAPVLEVPVPAAPAELPPVSAVAEVSEAKL